MPRKAPAYELIASARPVVATADSLGDGVLSVKDAAKFCAHGRSWLYERMDAGDIPFFMVGSRRVVAKAALVAFLAAERAKAGAT